MQAALYFPVIRGRPGEVRALQMLSPLARARVAPIVDLPRIEQADAEALEDHVGAFIGSLAPAWGTRFPIYIDLTRYNPREVDRRGLPIAEYLFDCARQAKVRAVPVAGTLTERGPSPAYLEAVTRSARRGGHGAALRITYEDYSDTAVLSRELSEGLGRLGLAAQEVDLFLDAGSIALMTAEHSDERTLIDTLSDAAEVCAQYDFRSVVFVGSSVPRRWVRRRTVSPGSLFGLNCGFGRNIYHVPQPVSCASGIPVSGIRVNGIRAVVDAVHRRRAYAFLWDSSRCSFGEPLRPTGTYVFKQCATAISRSSHDVSASTK